MQTTSAPVTKAAAGLGFSNHLIKLQSVSTFQHGIEAAAKKNGTPLDIKHPQLASLVDGFRSQSLSTVTACCAVLTSAASPQQRWVEPHSLLAFLITQAATTQHYAVITDAIGRVLVGELIEGDRGEGEEGYQCPYSLRSNVHPFISVLNSRPESGFCIVNKSIELLQKYHTSSVLKLLEPFVKYVLLSPTPTSELMLVGDYLHSQLISLARNIHHEHHHRAVTSSEAAATQSVGTIAKLLVKMVPLQAVKTDPQLLKVVSMVQRLVELQAEVMRLEFSKDLIDICLSLACELTRRGLPSVMLIESTVKLVSAIKEKKLAVHHSLVLSWLLLNNLLSPSVIEALLRVLEKTGEHSHSPLLIFPLIQLLSQPVSTMSLFGSHDLVSTNQKTASTLLKSIDSSSHRSSDRSVETIVSCCSGQYSLLVSAAQNYATIADDSDRVSAWLKSLTSRCAGDKTPSGSSDHLVVVLAALALQYSNTEGGIGVVESTLLALCNIAKRDPTVSPSILPYFLYLTSIMSDPSSKLTLLYSIPYLATHKLSSVAVGNTIITLGKTPSLFPVAIRLIGKAWQLQDHLFPLVQEFLSRPLPTSMNGATIKEVALARAAVIRDICNKRAEQHGEEMLSLISAVLSTGSPDDPLPIAMVIEGLVSLCNAEVVDVATLWEVLEGGERRLSRDGRPVVVGTLCQLFELAAEVDTESRHLNKCFKTTALKSLWKYALSMDAHISSSAWKALKRFPLEDHLVGYLPHEVAAHLRQGPQQHDAEQLDSDVATPLSGSQCVQLLQWAPLESLGEYSDFLSSLLEREVRDIGRGVVYSALREAGVASQSERVLESTVESLSAMCADNASRGTTPAGLISGTLMSAYGRSVGVKGRQQNAGRQLLNERLQQCLAKLEEFLKNSLLYSNLSSGDGGDASSWMGLSCLYLGRQWSHFMETLGSAYCQVRLLDTCSVSVQDDPANPVLVGKLDEANSWSMVQVLGKLEEFAKVNPDYSSRVFMSLVGVVSSAIGQVDHMTQTSIGRKSHDQLPSELLDCAVFILGGEVKVSPSAPTLQAVMRAKQPDLKTAVILSLPSLVSTIMVHCWDGVPETIATKLVMLASKLLEEMLRAHPNWYVTVVLNQVLESSLPVITTMSLVLNKLLSHIDVALQTESLELLSVLSGFTSTLCLCKRTIPVALKVLTLLQKKLQSLQPPQLEAAETQLCSLHLANGLTVMFAAGHLSEDEGMASVTLLADLATKAPHVSVFHLSLSMALFGLSSHGHRNSLALSDTIAAKWLQDVNEGGDEEKILPLLLGLAGLLGLDPTALSECYGSSSYGVVHTSFLKTLSPLVLGLLQKCVTHPSDVVCSTALWLTLQIYHSVSSVYSVTERVPENYGYLPENTILNSAYGLLDTLSSSLSDSNSGAYLGAILSAFTKCGQVPPANFSRLMVPFLKCDTTLQSKCVECMVHNKDTLGFKQFITFCCTHSVFVSLEVESQTLLLENLPIFSSSLSPSNLSRFLHSILGPLIIHHHLSNTKWLLSLLTGLTSTLKLDDIKLNTKHLIIITVKNLYTLLSQYWEKENKCSIHLVDTSILQSLAICLSLCDDCSSLVTLPTNKDSISNVAPIVRCCWVAEGLRKFPFIEAVVDWLLSNIDSHGITYHLCWLLHVITKLKRRPQTSQLIQTDMLHILLSWTRNNKSSPSQMEAVLVLAVSSVCVDSQVPWANGSVEELHIPLPPPTLDELFSTCVALVVPPETPVIREKLCQCLLEWLHSASDVKVCNSIIGVLAVMKSCSEYCRAQVWTFVAHVL